MDTYYLIDFENVHNEGIENITSLTKNEHVHIFSTANALNIRMDLVFSNGIDIEGHIVPVRKQSLDMHLVSFLGYLIAVNGKQCAYVIVSKDADYDNIIKFWKEEGYPHISRKQKIPGTSANQNKAAQPAGTAQATSVGIACNFSGNDRTKLNTFVMHELLSMGYSGNDVGTICRHVIAHCNDKNMLSGIHNDLRSEYGNYLKVYEDVKTILGKYELPKVKSAKREAQVRSFFGQHFKKKVYTDKKEEIVKIVVDAKTKQQVNESLKKLYTDMNVVSHIYQTVKPLIKDLPGK